MLTLRLLDPRRLKLTLGRKPRAKHAESFHTLDRLDLVIRAYRRKGKDKEDMSATERVMDAFFDDVLRVVDLTPRFGEDETLSRLYDAGAAVEKSSRDLLECDDASVHEVLLTVAVAALAAKKGASVADFMREVRGHIDVVFDVCQDRAKYERMCVTEGRMGYDHGTRRWYDKDEVLELRAYSTRRYAELKDENHPRELPPQDEDAHVACFADQQDKQRRYNDQHRGEKQATIEASHDMTQPKPVGLERRVRGLWAVQGYLARGDPANTPADQATASRRLAAYRKRYGIKIRKDNGYADGVYDARGGKFLVRGEVGKKWLNLYSSNGTTHFDSQDDAEAAMVAFNLASPDEKKQMTTKPPAKRCPYCEVFIKHPAARASHVKACAEKAKKRAAAAAAPPPAPSKKKPRREPPPPPPPPPAESDESSDEEPEPAAAAPAWPRVSYCAGLFGFSGSS